MILTKNFKLFDFKLFELEIYNLKTYLQNSINKKYDKQYFTL